ncbi:MAG: acylphosphatase [Corticimicrobacter sp.]|uniref:acylphosphatase n=1 Tax=Corticimicrobacter populi TaxID=2175229 RepID=A0A2V1JYA0_9BURK|nr:acylphosphatase [Corticimicrobacter populi]PWF22082.1 acylphosphatase [Corticimicrobacter populi]QDQ86151.1 acylphosphatase [Alcaligenaceae bacterium SJ-26]
MRINSIETVKVVITGKVQGVYYRHNTVRMAHELKLCGWVQNIDDGSVHALLQGEADQIDRMLAWMRQGPPAARVDEVVSETIAHDKRYERFQQL